MRQSDKSPASVNQSRPISFDEALRVCTSGGFSPQMEEMAGCCHLLWVSLQDASSRCWFGSCRSCCFELLLRQRSCLSMQLALKAEFSMGKQSRDRLSQGKGSCDASTGSLSCSPHINLLTVFSTNYWHLGKSFFLSATIPFVIFCRL